MSENMKNGTVPKLGNFAKNKLAAETLLRSVFGNTSEMAKNARARLEGKKPARLRPWFYEKNFRRKRVTDVERVTDLKKSRCSVQTAV